MPLDRTNSFIDQSSSPATTEQNQALENLRRESQVHKQQNADRGLIGLAVTGATEFWHGSAASGKKLDSIATDMAACLKTGISGPVHARQIWLCSSRSHRCFR
jgi:hypothetical protein